MSFLLSVFVTAAVSARLVPCLPVHVCLINVIYLHVSWKKTGDWDGDSRPYKTRHPDVMPPDKMSPDKNNPGQNAIVLFCVWKMLIRSRILAKTHKCYRLRW